MSGDAEGRNLEIRFRELPSHRPLLQAPRLATGEVCPEQTASRRVAPQPRRPVVLNQVLIPVHEIAGMKPTHIAVLVGLKSFADRTGKCWPTLRTLADAPETMREVTRHFSIGDRSRQIFPSLPFRDGVWAADELNILAFPTKAVQT